MNSDTTAIGNEPMNSNYAQHIGNESTYSDYAEHIALSASDVDSGQDDYFPELAQSISDSKPENNKVTMEPENIEAAGFATTGEMDFVSASEPITSESDMGEPELFTLPP